MPTVTCITDLSPNSVVNFAALAAQKTLCPLFSRRGLITSNQNVWKKAKDAVKEMGSPRQPLRAWLGRFSEMARSGGDLLLFGQEPASISHTWLLRLLRSVPEAREYTVRAIVCLGRPDVVLEQHCRLAAAQMLSPEAIRSLIGNFSRLDALIRMLLRELGEENVIVLRDPVSSAIPGRAISQGFRECLDLPEEAAINPQHVLLLNSAPARALWFAIRSIRNSWPLCDALLFAALAECEKTHAWSTANVSSPKQRQAILNACEKSHGWISENFFAGKPLFDVPCVAREEWFPYAGLRDDCLLTFAEELPADGRTKLLRRLESVQPLLTQDQKRIAGSLKRVRTASQSPAVETRHREEPYTLSVATLAYNQEKYIAECIESVAAQQTKFRFKHIILDHGSRDGTPDIISRYAEKYSHIVPVLMPDHLLKGENVRTLFSVADTPYVALCDGDDYFTDPLKLQKQVDFLENHQECALCFHPVDVMYEDGSPSRVYPPEDILPGGVRRFYTIKDLFSGNIIQTNSVMYRWRFCEGLPDWFICNLSPGDWYWHLLHAETGLIGYLSEHMSVYRRHAASIHATAEKHHVGHRKEHGLRELRVYHIVNQHFKGRYYDDVRCLAIGVLADFLQIYIVTGDDMLLQTAAGLYPDFTRDFLSEVQKTSSLPPRL